MSITIRPGELKDLDWLIRQLRDFSDFAGTKHKLFGDIVVARNGMIRLMKDHVVLVAERPTALVGFIAGVVTPHIMNPHVMVLAELFWWVEPSARGASAASELLDAFVKEGEKRDENGKKRVDWITFGLMTKTKVKEAGLQRRGFTLFEKAYLRET